MKSNKKAIKTTKSTTPVNRKTKVVEMYKDMFFLREYPISEAFIERLAADMVEWAKKETSLKLTDFFWDMGIHNQVVYRWMEKWPILKRAWEFAGQRIASRREVGAITRKLDPGAIEKFQGMVDPEYKNFLQWKASLATTEKQGTGTVIVRMEAAPTSDRVPERKQE